MNRRRWLHLLLIYGILTPGALVVLVPYVWMVITSVKEDRQILTMPPVFVPDVATLRHYETIIFRTDIPRYFLNSVIVATTTAVVAVIFGGMAAYAFSRFKFAGRDALTMSVVFTQMLPLAVLLIPLFIFWRHVGLFDTLLILIITYLAFALPLSILLLRSFLSTIPVDLEAAAMIDGCSRIGAFFRIVMPLSMPAIAATALYTFLAAWQEYMFALAFISSKSNRTMPIGMSSFIGENAVNWGGMMATAVLFTAPVIPLFLVLQKFLTRGLTLGAVRG